MRTKSLLLTIFALFIGLAAFAQDKIIKKNGEIIEAKVSIINQDNIVFKRFDNLDGPEYSIPKADVSRIKYKNGTEDIFEEDNDKIGVARRDMAPANTGNSTVKGRHSMHDDERGLKPNIISLAPIAVTQDGVGIGASIEHSLDAKGVVNFYMPVFASFQRNYDNYTTSYTTAPMFYVMPGIKIYTNLNSSKKMKFSIGPSLVVGAGKTLLSNYDYNTGNTNTSTQNRFVLGGMANIGFNIFPTQHLYMGAEYGLGFAYLDQVAGATQGFSGLTQFSLKIGYRFGSKK